MSQVSYGTITITDTTDIESIVVEYNQNQSSTNAPNQSDSGWSMNRPTWAEDYYIWQRTRAHRSGTSASDDILGTPVCITGSTGSTGTPGRSLTKTVTQYTTAASSATITQSNMGSYTWTDDVPSYSSSKPAYWARVTNTYSNPSSIEYIFYKDNGITDAMSAAADAQITAKDAKDIADQAKDDASNALQIATGINQHFWTIASDYSTDIPAGSYITDTAIDTFKSQKKGGNLLTRSDGIYIRNGVKTLASLTGTALTFYNPTSNTAQLIIGANGALQSGNYSRGSDTKFSTNGTKIDLVNGDIITRYFRLSQGLETDLNAGVYVHGTIEALDGSIGTDTTNYWQIGNKIDYNLNASAMMIGHGSSFIQLGDDSTWRLATNRIHTGWYDPTEKDLLIHFPIINSKYWDYGLHTPTTATDKFLYIRNSKNSSSASATLQNLLYDIDDDYGVDQWDYKFYIAADGSLYARNLYVLNDDGSAIQVGGTDGVYLLKTGGTITGNLEVNGTLTKGGKSVVYFSSTPTNGQIVITDGTGGGVKTSGFTIATSVPSGAVFTDKNVQTAARGSTKMYLAGSSTTGTTTGTLLTDSTVYIETSNSKANLVTPLINGYTLAAASAKGVDTSLTVSSTSTNLPTTAAVANLIKGYLPLTGGQVTGPTTFGDSVSIDELTVGDLVVNGLASFTNNAQFNKINGVVVGTNPKFTDTVTTVTTTGTGNAITSATASNGVITFVKSATYLSGTGTNGYLAKWNGGSSLTNGPALGTATNTFLRNDGTWAVPAGTGVTSVAASGSGGITISGSPITTSGTISIGLNLSTAINGLSEGTSPATRNDYLVAQYAGGGTTTTSYHRRSVANIFKALLASDIPNLSWTKITSDKPTTSTGYGITDAITDIGSNDAGQLVLTFSNGTTGTRTVSITATEQSSVAKAEALNTKGAKVGDTNKPVYFGTDGKPVAISYTIDKSVPSTAVFTDTTYTIASGDSNGQIKVTPSSGSAYNVSVKGWTSWLPLTGGTLSGKLTVGTTSQSAAPTAAIHVHDLRSYEIPPAMFNSGVNWFFSNKVMPDTNWWSGMHVNGWTGDYNAWELVGPSHNSDQRTGALYVRSGKTTNGWGSWRKIYDSSNKPTKAEIGLGNVDNTADANKSVKHATDADYVNFVGGRVASADIMPSTMTSKVQFTLATSTMTTSKPPAGDGYITTYAWDNSNWGAQFYIRHDQNTPYVMVRGTNGSTWGNWKYLLGEFNYTDYTVTKTGGGASGTWGISISGSAANVSGTVGTANGGTGNTSFTANKLTYAETASKLSSASGLSYFTGNSTASSTATYTRLHINGNTYGNTATNMISGTAGLFSFGDGGPQITFDTSATPGGGQAGALIFTDHDSAAAGASWHFVSNQTDWNVTSKRFHARTGISVGTNLPNTSYNLYVNGTTYLNGSTTVNGNTLKIANNSNTVTIGSQNASFTHIYNSASIPFIINNSLLTTSGDLGNNTYPFKNVNITGGYNMLVSGAQKANMHYDATLDAIVFSFA